MVAQSRGAKRGDVAVEAHITKSAIEGTRCLDDTKNRSSILYSACVYYTVLDIVMGGMVNLHGVILAGHGDSEPGVAFTN
jgi:hypothetical protein